MNTQFLADLKDLLNTHSIDNELNTPDFILATWIGSQLDTFKETIGARKEWVKIENTLYNFSCPCSWLHKGVTNGFQCKCGIVFDKFTHDYSLYKKGR